MTGSLLVCRMTRDQGGSPLLIAVKFLSRAAPPARSRAGKLSTAYGRQYRFVDAGRISSAAAVDERPV